MRNVQNQPAFDLFDALTICDAHQIAVLEQLTLNFETYLEPMSQQNFPRNVFYLSAVLQLYCTVVNSHIIISGIILYATSGRHTLFKGHL